MRTSAVLSVVVAIAATLALALTGIASAHPGPASVGGHDRGCSGGRADGQGASVTNSFRFTLCAHGDDPHQVSGYFSAVAIAPAGALVAPQGPVTCAAVTGNTVSFLYPLARGSRPAVLADRTAILIVAVDGGPSGPDRIGFIGPAPTATFGDRCDLATPQAVAALASAQPVLTGSVTVTGPRS